MTGITNAANTAAQAADNGKAQDAEHEFSNILKGDASAPRGDVEFRGEKGDPGARGEKGDTGTGWPLIASLYTDRDNKYLGDKGDTGAPSATDTVQLVNEHGQTLKHGGIYSDGNGNVSPMIGPNGERLPNPFEAKEKGDKGDTGAPSATDTPPPANEQGQHLFHGGIYHGPNGQVAPVIGPNGETLPNPFEGKWDTRAPSATDIAKLVNEQGQNLLHGGVYTDGNGNVSPVIGPNGEKLRNPFEIDAGNLVPIDPEGFVDGKADEFVPGFDSRLGPEGIQPLLHGGIYPDGTPVIGPDGKERYPGFVDEESFFPKPNSQPPIGPEGFVDGKGDEFIPGYEPRIGPDSISPGSDIHKDLYIDYEPRIGPDTIAPGSDRLPFFGPGGGKELPSPHIPERICPGRPDRPEYPLPNDLLIVDMDQTWIDRNGDDSKISGNGDDYLNGLDGDDTISGGGGKDTIIGGDGNNKLHGGDGDDHVTSNDGEDLVNGGDGNDTLLTGGGNDTVGGGDGNDGIHGEDGDDLVDGGAGNDTVHGGRGNDTLKGGDGDDLVSDGGYDGKDVLDGGAGNDTVRGYAGNDTMTGGTGNDSMEGGHGDDSMEGGEGHDRMLGGEGDDTMEGGSGSDRMLGGEGNDAMAGGDGKDFMRGGEGNDTMNGGAGNDDMDGGAGNDFMRGGTGNDTMSGGAGDDTVIGDSGDDLLDGEDGNDVVYGGDGDDTLLGGAGNDSLNGGEGNNLLDGGTGDDRLISGWGGNSTLKGGEGNDSLESGGGTGDDLMDGGTGNDTIAGGAGDDTLKGGTGDDVLVGGFNNGKWVVEDGNDFLEGGSGNDSINGQSGDDTLDGGSGDDVILTGKGDDVVYAGNGDDLVVVDGSGNKVLFGGDGNDTLVVYGNEEDYSMTKDESGTVYITNDDGTNIVANGFENIVFAPKPEATVVPSWPSASDFAPAEPEVVEVETGGIFVSMGTTRFSNDGNSRFLGADGGEYDMLGEAGKTYNILSDTGIQMNATYKEIFVPSLSILEEGRTLPVVEQVGFTTEEGKFTVNSDGTVEIFFENDSGEVGTVLVSGPGEYLHGAVTINDQGHVIVNAGEYEITFDKFIPDVPQKEGFLEWPAGYIGNIEIRSDDANSDGKLPSGLWGATVDGDGVARYKDPDIRTYNRDGEVIKPGDRPNVELYEVSDIFDTDFDNFNNF